jgi:hypothetical protein
MAAALRRSQQLLSATATAGGVNFTVQQHFDREDPGDAFPGLQYAAEPRFATSGCGPAAATGSSNRRAAGHARAVQDDGALMMMYQSGDAPLLAVESAFIFPAGMQPVERAPSQPHACCAGDDESAAVQDGGGDDDNLELASGSRLTRPPPVSDSMAELWARPEPVRHAASAPGLLAEATEAAEAAAGAPEDVRVSTVLPLDEFATSRLEAVAAGASNMAAAAVEAELNAPPEAAASAAPAPADGRSDGVGGGGGGAGSSGDRGGSTADQRSAGRVETPLDLAGLSQRNDDKLRLLDGINLDGPGGGGGQGVEALDVFLKRFVSGGNQGGGSGGGSGDGSLHGSGDAAGAAAGSGGDGGALASSMQQRARARWSSGGGGSGSGVRFEAAAAAGGEGETGSDSLDQELSRLLSSGPQPHSSSGRRPRASRASDPGGSGGGSGHRVLSTSINSFACRLAQPAVAPPLGLGLGTGLPSALAPIQ